MHLAERIEVFWWNALPLQSRYLERSEFLQRLLMKGSVDENDPEIAEKQIQGLGMYFFLEFIR